MLAQCCKPDPLKAAEKCSWAVLAAFSLRLTLTLSFASALGGKGWVCPCDFLGFGSLQGKESHLLAPTAAWVEAMGLQDGAGMRGKPSWCGRNSKAMHYCCTSACQHSTSGRFITISLGTHKCSQPLFSAPAWCQTSVVWTGGHPLKVQEDVFIPSHFSSPFPFLHTLKGILLLLASFISIPSCVTLVWEQDFHDSHCSRGSIFSSHQGKVSPRTCTQSSQE